MIFDGIQAETGGGSVVYWVVYGQGMYDRVVSEFLADLNLRRD